MDNRLKGETEGILFNGKSKQTYFFRSVSHSLNDHEGISDAQVLGQDIFPHHVCVVEHGQSAGSIMARVCKDRPGIVRFNCVRDV